MVNDPKMARHIAFIEHQDACSQWVPCSELAPGDIVLEGPRFRLVLSKRRVLMPYITSDSRVEVTWFTNNDGVRTVVYNSCADFRKVTW